MDGRINRLSCHCENGWVFARKFQGEITWRQLCRHWWLLVLGRLDSCSFYTLPTFAVERINTSWTHTFTPTTHMFVSARQQEAGDAEQRLVDCTEDIAQWMASNRLKMNPAKIDFMWCATHRCQHQLSKDHMTFAGSDIQLSSTVWDLHIILDSKLSFGPHVSQLVSRCFLQLRSIKSCVCSLPMDAAKTVVNSFVIYRVNYCNSLLAGAPWYQLDHLQSVLNTAARLLVGAKKHDHIRHVLRDRLHWLPVQQHVQFKLGLDRYQNLPIPPIPIL